jgi:hypothetical protein
LGQRLQFQPGEVPVFPQRRHRVRRGFAGSQGEHHIDRAAQNQLVDQRRGQLIK